MYGNTAMQRLYIYLTWLPGVTSRPRRAAVSFMNKEGLSVGLLIAFLGRGLKESTLSKGTEYSTTTESL